MDRNSHLVNEVFTVVSMLGEVNSLFFNGVPLGMSTSFQGMLYLQDSIHCTPIFKRERKQEVGYVRRWGSIWE